MQKKPRQQSRISLQYNLVPFYYVLSHSSFFVNDTPWGLATYDLRVAEKREGGGLDKE